MTFAHRCQQPDVEGYTPLHAAALAGAIEATLALLEAGAMVDKLDKAGRRPDACVPPGNPSLARLLSVDHRQMSRTASTGYRDVAPGDRPRSGVPRDDYDPSNHNDEQLDVFAAARRGSVVSASSTDDTTIEYGSF